MDTTITDPELRVLKTVIDVLRPFTPEERQRILASVARDLGVSGDTEANGLDTWDF